MDAICSFLLSAGSDSEKARYDSGLAHSRKAYPGPLVPKPELFEAMLAAAAASGLRKK